MNTKFLLSPAYLASVGAMLVGALLAGTDYMMIGWILFIIGLALNAMSLVVLANREQLRRVSAVGALPRVHKPQAPAEATSGENGAVRRPVTPGNRLKAGKITDSHQIFPDK